MIKIEKPLVYFLFLILFCTVTSASAATFTVRTTVDGGQNSLRQAVNSANSLNEDVSIVFLIPQSDPGCSTSTRVCTISLTAGEMVIAKNGTLNITNGNPNNLIISGNNLGRVFVIGSTVLISGVTISGGNGIGAAPSGSGGAILVAGSGNLTIQSVHVTGNSAVNGGGGISAGGTLNVINSTISNNETSSGGGGISAGGTLNVTNSTISGNSSINSGGGLSTGGNATFTNATITGNYAIGCAGLYAGGFGATSFRNTIMAANANSRDICRSNGAFVQSLGHNLIGNSANTGALIVFQSSDRLDVPPGLRPLGMYGGFTPTCALLPSSAASNGAVNVSGIGTDQRGFPRGAQPDIGAFERQPALMQVSGRVSASSGFSAASSFVTFRDIVTGQISVASTNQSGYYRFYNLDEGKTYAVDVISKKWVFAPRMVTLTDQISNFDFISTP